MTKTLNADWTIIIDTREQFPWLFEGITIGTGKSKKDLVLPVEVATLKTGDYSIKGFEHLVAIERKSKDDLFYTLSQERNRFIRELSRLNEMRFAAVVVESEWSDCMTNPPLRSKFAPVSMYGLVVAWMIRYSRVHWCWYPDRFTASKAAYKILDRFWKEFYVN